MALTNLLTNSTLTRRALLRGLAYASLTGVLVACGGKQASAPLPSVPLDSFPDEVGRGFPVGSLVGADNSNTGIKEGEVAPNFRFQLSEEQGLYLSDLVGRPILINFWATWCGPCRLEMPEIVARSVNTPDLLVIAINVQEVEETVAAFADDFQMKMPVVRDVDAEIRDLYQVRGMPTSAFINREGKIAVYREGVMSPKMIEEYLAAIV